MKLLRNEKEFKEYKNSFIRQDINQEHHNKPCKYPCLVETNTHRQNDYFIQHNHSFEYWDSVIFKLNMFKDAFFSNEKTLANIWTEDYYDFTE